MTILIILLVAAAVFGVGAVVEGLAWAALIGVALVVAAAITGFRLFSGDRPRTTRT